MIVVLWVLLFAVLALRHALPAGLGREAVIGILSGPTLGLSVYADAPWDAAGPGLLPAATVAVAGAGVAAGYLWRHLLIAERSWS
ncbi:hypothetical protein [Kocuria sp. NPDC057446]|uniref:hypothetical protein n=1 Tax=Kocuria sp. NPDC057446 TaxID=3346137 RepID=UPI00369A75A9